MNFLSLTHNRLLMLLMIGLTLSVNNAAAEGRDPGGIASDAVGSRILSSYSGSYALLIGESQYTNGWPNLETIPGELREVEKVLQSQGFKVEMSFNLNAEDLTKRFNRFINQYGFEENNRLLFFYSGHGYTRKDKGYIVPVDAANPNFDERAFLRKALEMNQLTTWARRIEAKHVLFLFDSCFSGSVFKAKDLPKIPPQISQAAALSVRQFITAGSANETVPAQSVFALVFVDALRHGFGDTNKDGYVTGQELGLYLWNKVPQHTEQTPQYGKIQDYKLSRGDFVFVVGSGATVIIIPPAPPNPPAPGLEPPGQTVKPNFKPSFDCARAETPTEMKICNNSELSHADAQLSRIYSQLRQSLSKSNFKRLKNEQWAWLKQRDYCSDDLSCLSRTYNQRIFELEAKLSLKPSFNCAKATTKTENSICSNSELSHADRQISELYSQLRRSLSKSDAKWLQKEQRAWLKRRNTCYDDVNCLLQAYEDRITELAH